MALVESYIDSGLAVITLSDSDNGNRLNLESLTQLSHEFNSVVMNDSTRAILIQSNGKNFSLGMDLNFVQATSGDRQIAEKTVDIYTSLLLKIYEATVPVIALVNGNVKAGGNGLVAACDIVVASQDSTFEMGEVLFGLIPANVLPFIYAKRIMPQKARYIILTSKCLTAQEAKEIGLVDEVFGANQLEKGIKSIIKQLFRAAPHAMAALKDFTRKIESLTINDSCNIARQTLLDLVAKPEVIEGISAFNEGSIPKWFTKFKPEKQLIIPREEYYA